MFFSLARVYVWYVCVCMCVGRRVVACRQLITGWAPPLHGTAHTWCSAGNHSRMSAFGVFPQGMCSGSDFSENFCSVDYRDGLVEYFRGKGFQASARVDALPDDDFVFLGLYLYGYSSA